MKKWVIGGVAGIILLGLAGTGGYFYYQYKTNELKLEEDTIYVELGGKNKEYLNVEDFVGEAMPESEMKKVEATVDLFKDNKGKVKAGTYEVVFKYKPISFLPEKTSRGYLVIEDTTSPVISVDTDQIYIEENAVGVDIEKYLMVNDYSPYELDMNTKSVNYGKAGKYTVEIRATDTAGNETKAKITLNIVTSRSLWEGEVALTPYANGDTPVSKETQGYLDKGLISDVNTKSKMESLPNIDADVKEPEPEPEKKDEDKDKDNKNDKPVVDACMATVPPEGILSYEDAVKSAENYLDMTGLSETHTYSMEKKSVPCGRVYYIYSIVLK